MKHLITLTLKLVLLGVCVAVRPDREGSGAWLKPDAVTDVAARGQTLRLGEQ
jgi:hypothetical protein